jgi:hypothetical protein
MSDGANTIAELSVSRVMGWIDDETGSGVGLGRRHGKKRSVRTRTGRDDDAARDKAGGQRTRRPADGGVVVS